MRINHLMNEGKKKENEIISVHTPLEGLRDRIVLNDVVHIQMYVKCHIMLLFGTVLFGDKSSATFSWDSACLAHLYISLCRATRVDCKEMEGPLTLLLTWAWIRLPFLAPILGNPRVFPIANRWRNWDRENYAYRYNSLAHYRRLLDDLQEGHFVWEAYGIGNIDPDVIPLDIHHNSVIWSATVPLISFECIEWHASDRVRRKFGLSQGVPNQERDLGASHGKILTGPKNQDWANTHSSWVMQWTNRYSRPSTSVTSIVLPYLPTVLLLHFGNPDQPVTTIPIFCTFGIEYRRFRLIYPIVHTSPDGIIFHCLDYCLP
ncbi:hypothetical protein Ahy_A09g041459 [Arachis hypogaea]|uniref:Aminotransferase-like plant mobile domain-containing protein n=1 Tax=Arachis hypogaea TaxID=3818 RepID=A0A445BCU5_ARAHY|nr:hypothetical protein Ahy_A09g041459 [Arachis hypogaea]